MSDEAPLSTRSNAEPEPARERAAPLLAATAHELRLPLSHIKGFVSTLRRTDVTWDRATQDDFLHEIEIETERLAQLVDSLLLASSVNRISVPSVDMNLVCPDRVIYSALHRVRGLLGDRTVRVDTRRRLPAVRMERGAMERVLANLLQNAIKYSPPGTPIGVAARMTNGELEFSVDDEGPGVPAEDRERIFEPFFRRQTTGSGEGLGLAISQAIVLAHGGRVHVGDRPGGGARFTVVLPAPTGVKRSGGASAWGPLHRRRLAGERGHFGSGQLDCRGDSSHGDSSWARQFERVYWRSVRNAPPVEEWLAGATGFLSDQQMVPAREEAAQINAVLQLLRERRCLLVLDNIETLLEPGSSDGGFLDSAAGYGRLLKAIAQRSHQSCLIGTSRELSAQFAMLRGSPAVRALALRGLTVAEAQALLEDKQLVGDEATWGAFIARFGGNSLALKIAGENIHQIFGGDLAAFFDQAGPSTVFGGIRRLLDEQVERSSPLELDALTRLAIEREPVTVAELVSELGASVSTGPALDAIEALRRRSLAERVDGGAGFTLQSVVLEYLTERLVDRVSREVAVGQPDELLRWPLIKARAKDYVRLSQERLIAQPILKHLVASSGTTGAERRLLDLLELWRGREQAAHGYGPGNVINLLRLLRGNLRHLDFLACGSDRRTCKALSSRMRASSTRGSRSPWLEARSTRSRVCKSAETEAVSRPAR